MSATANEAASSTETQPNRDVIVSSTSEDSVASYTVEWAVKVAHNGTQITTFSTTNVGHRLSWRLLFDWNNNNSGTSSFALQLTDACCVNAPVNIQGSVKVADLTPTMANRSRFSNEVGFSGRLSMDETKLQINWFNSNALDQFLVDKPELRLILTARAEIPHETMQPISWGLMPFFNSELLSDVRLVVGCKTFNAHKLVLVARSNVFRTMFQGDGVKQHTIEISDDVSGDVFGHFLRFLYSDELEHEALAGDGVATGLFVLSDKYKNDALKRRTSTWLRKRLSEDSVLLVAHLSVTHDCTVLRDTCIAYIVRNLGSISAREEWPTFVQQHPELISSIMVKMHEAAKINNQNYFSVLEVAPST